MRLRITLLGLLLATLACNTLFPSAATLPPPITPTRRPTAQPTLTATAPAPTETPVPTSAPATEEALATPEPPPDGVRACDYDPLVSAPAQMPPEVLAEPTPSPYAPAALPTNTPVDAATTRRQLKVFDELVKAVDDNYVYPDFNGVDWPAIVKRYRALTSAGLTDDDFYFSMENLLVELRDDHSQYWSPAMVTANSSTSSGHTQYVGIGALVTAMPEQGYGVIAYTLLGGTAAEAGLKAHDIILAVDGQPLLDADGNIGDVIRGPEGSHVTLTMRHPGGEKFDLTLERRKIDSPDPVNACLIPRTRVAYIFLPSLEDETIPDQLREALRKLTADGPLDGLILDNRLNGGGSYPVFTGVLSFFMDGTVGYFVNRQSRDQVGIDGEDLGGSQSVPLVVLVSQDTASFGEIMSGVLRSLGRARVVGGLTLGNVEILYPYEFDDGSLAYIAHDTFQPVGQEAGVWEQTGIVPDVEVPARWDLFTEATDPAIAAALQVFSAQGKQVPVKP